MAKRQRLRQLLVNSVMATDIFDEDLRVLRQLRWEQAASSVNCKATLVMEHVLQTSDVGHTMQSWEIYREWNERLFNEMYAAFRDGRAEKDPSESWYQGELWFFDNWVLPLTHSLKRSGALNIISEQLLEQASQNRLRWEREGQEVCEAMMMAAKKRPRRTTSFNTLSSSSFRSDSLTAAESSLASTMLGEIESLSKVMQRYERKMETACGNLIAITRKSERDTRSIGPGRKSWSSLHKHLRQHSIPGDEDSFGEISALTIEGSNHKSLQEMLDKAEAIAKVSKRRWQKEKRNGDVKGIADPIAGGIQRMPNTCSRITGLDVRGAALFRYSIQPVLPQLDATITAEQSDDQLWLKDATLTDELDYHSEVPCFNQNRAEHPSHALFERIREFKMLPVCHVPLIKRQSKEKTIARSPYPPCRQDARTNNVLTSNTRGMKTARKVNTVSFMASILTLPKRAMWLLQGWCHAV
eukprot:scaffold3128_cov90-Cylindrotheca_fusiformis.AAC.2